MGVEGSDGLAGGWLFAHLEVLLPTWGSGPIAFEPELLSNVRRSLLPSVCDRRPSSCISTSASVGIRVADRLAPIRQLGRLGSQRVGLGSLDRPLVMGGGSAVSRSPGRSYLLLADDLEAAGLSSELPL